MDFVPCVKWVRKGTVVGKPDKIELTREELTEIIRSAEVDAEGSESETDANPDDLYDMEHYDDPPPPSNSLGIGSIALYESNDPVEDDQVDSDDQDEEIKPDDNLIVVSKGFRDNSCMESIEIYVYNESRGEMYVHHDIMVSSCPLCFQCIDIKYQDKLSSFLVAGLMSSCIEIYDLNIVNPVKPQAKLGSKKKDSSIGHSDAVLDLSWNTNYPHILASSSADKTVALWDLETISLSDKFEEFEGNVENIDWDSNGHTLLCCDSSGNVKLLDCRDYSTASTRHVRGEALVARFSSSEPNQFYIGTSKGRILCYDRRNDSPLFKLKAHESDITGISPVKGYSGLLVSACVSGDIKLWDTNPDPQRVLFNKSLKAEQVHSLDTNPDNPLVVGIGGAKKKGAYFNVLNLNKGNSLNELLDFRKIQS